MPTSPLHRPFARPFSRSAAALLLSGCALGPAWAADTPIYAIQGSGKTSPLAGQTVTTIGVVTRVVNNGFFLQDLTGDGDPATSDGILVFTSTAPTVAAGQYLRLTGRVTEFNTGAASNADTVAHTVTELTAISGLQTLGSGYAVAPVLVTLPEQVNDDLERYEGMLITLAGPLTVAQNFFQGRYGQLTLAVGGRLETPTNRARPGPAADAVADENMRRRIVLDDGSSVQNPNPTPYLGADGTLRAGDTVPSLTGVLDYGLATASNTGFGDYKLHPTVAPVFTRANPRSTAPAAVGGNVRVASFNVLNYFTTFTNGQTATGQTGQGCSLGGAVSAGNCRGADNAAEFARQRTKIVEAIAAIDADAVGVMELQNNGATALGNLIDGLNARLGTGTYAAVPDPTGAASGGTGSDAIKVAMLYKPARLALFGASASDAAAIHSRPPLAQTFSLANGEAFTVVVNHFKSKGSCPASTDVDGPGNTDSGDGQGCWNRQRLQQAAALRSFVARLQAASGSNDVLLIGDFNAYGQEDPVVDLTSSGYVDQVGRFNAFGYSYVFDGAAGRLDQAITSASLSAKVTRAIEWHINADEPAAIDYNLEFKAPLTCTGGAACPPDYYTPTPYRSSDHDPVVVGLSIFKSIDGTPGPDVLTGSPGDDRFTGGGGADVMTGHGGINVYAYASQGEGGDTVTDFVPGRDRIDVRALLAGLNYAGRDPFADGWMGLADSRSGVEIRVLRGHTRTLRLLVTLAGVTAAQIDPARDVIVR